MHRVAAYLCFALSLGSFAMRSSAQTGDVAVVVNAGNPVDGVSLTDLKKMFAGKKQSWPGNLPVKPIVRSSGTRERQALLRLLRMSEGDYKQHWTTEIFRGTAQSEPLTAPSNTSERQAVATFVGAIALIAATDVKPPMKIVKVDGHLPGDLDYPPELAEYRLKAGFLYRFAQFIEWPPEAFRDSSSPIRLCTTGPDPFGRGLDDVVAGKFVRGHALQVRHSVEPTDLTGCHILFIGETDQGRTTSLLADVKNLPIATVGDADRFVARGGLIGFVWAGEDIRFDVNLGAALAAKLTISAPLLSLAKSVSGVTKGK